MNNIISKRHIFKFYLSVIFVFIFFSSVGAVLLHNTNDLIQKGQMELKDYFLPIAALFLFFLAFYSVYTFRKNSPIIIIDPQRKSINFGSESFDLNEIKEISLTGKFPFRFIIKIPMEGASFVFNNGNKKFIFDDMYSNAWQLKKYIDQVIIHKNAFSESEAQKESNIDLRFENEEIFKGNPLISLRGISLWGLIGFFLGLMIFKMKSPTMGFIIFFFGFSTFWFLLNSWMMHYFSLTKDYFIVRNHNFFWMQKIYRINEIREIVFETQPRQPNCLRIITNDFRHKLYPAGTLRDKTWLYLKERLEVKGVVVRNECIYG